MKNESVLNLDEIPAQFKNYIHDFGEFTGTTISGEVLFERNPDVKESDLLDIKSVSPSCGCTIPEFLPKGGVTLKVDKIIGKNSTWRTFIIVEFENGHKETINLVGQTVS